MNPEIVREELLKISGIKSVEYFMAHEKTMFIFVFRTEDKRYGKLLNAVVRNKSACVFKKEVQAMKKEIKSVLNGQKRIAQA